MSSTPRPVMVTFYVPDDPELLQALGRVTIRHGHLDYVLRMTIKTLTGMSVNEAIEDTKKTVSGRLRERIKKLAPTKLGDGDAFEQLIELLDRAEVATEKRNRLVHDLWAQNVDSGDPMLREDASASAIPNVAQLSELEVEIDRIQGELNWSRLKGTIRAALDTRRLQS